MSELSKTEISLQLPQVMTRLSHLYVRQELTDLSIHCPNGELMAHKLVLNSVSEYFKQLLLKENTSVIIFCDILIEDIKTIIDCIYFGKQLVSTNRSQNLLKIAERLKIQLNSSEKNANKSLKLNKSLDKTALKNSIQSRPQNEAQNEVQNVVINDEINDISFGEEFKDESPIDLSVIQIGNKSSTDLELKERNEGKKRERKQKDPKPNRKFVKSDENQVIAKELIEESNESLKTALEEITDNYSNIPESKQSIKELFTLTDTHLDLKEISVQTSNADSYEKTIEYVVNSANTYCANTSDEKTLKKESIDELKECLLCDKTFRNEKQLIIHLKKVHKNVDQLFSCRFCDQSFKFAKKFAQHLIGCKIQFN